MHRQRKTAWLNSLKRHMKTTIGPVIVDASALAALAVAAFHVATALGWAGVAVGIFVLRWEIWDDKSS